MENNDFMNTGRPMTELGKLDSAKWTTIDKKPAALVSIGGDYNPPWVALYRRVPGGHWLQMTSIQEMSLDKLFQTSSCQKPDIRVMFLAPDFQSRHRNRDTGSNPPVAHALGTQFQELFSIYVPFSHSNSPLQ